MGWKRRCWVIGSYSAYTDTTIVVLIKFSGDCKRSKHAYPTIWKHHPNLLDLSIRRSCGAISHSSSLSLEAEFYLSHWTQQSAAAVCINILVATVEELRASCPFLECRASTRSLSLTRLLCPRFPIIHVCLLSRTEPLLMLPHSFAPSFSFPPSIS